MNFLKHYKKIVLFVLLAMLINPTYALTKICLTGSDVATLPTYGQSFLNGARLAQLQSPAGLNIEILPYFYNRQPLEAIRTYNKMRKDGCGAIIGFDSLTDLMLIAKYQKPPYIPIFTGYASTLSNDAIPKNFFIAMPPYDFLANKMINFLNARYDIKKNVLLITEINRNEMLDYKKTYSYLLSKHHISYDTFDFLEGDLSKNAKLKKIYLEKKYNYIFMFTTADDAATIANTIDDKNVIYIGTEYFGSTSDESFYIGLEDKSMQAYFIRNLDFSKPSDKLLIFKNNYISEFNKEPTILSAYAYDETAIILKMLYLNGTIKSNNFCSINYNGITGINIKNGKFYRSTYTVILTNTKTGYKYVR